MFIGRDSELNQLEEIYRREDNGIILVSGQPLVGKTELLSKFLAGKKGEYYFAKACTDLEQLRQFSIKMLGDEMTFSDWEQSLAFFAAHPAKEKQVLIIDEFQNLQKGNKNFLDILKKTWESKLILKKWFIVLATSSLAFLEKEFFDTNKHYEKMITLTLNLSELSPKVIKNFLPSYNEEQLIKTYSLIGGNPYLLKKWRTDLNLESNIKNILLQKESGFHYLVESIFHKEIREPQVYFTLLSHVAQGFNKLTDLNELMGIEKNKLAVYLKNLMNMGFLKREYSNEKYKSDAQSYSGVYKMSESYLQFYFQFIFPFLVDLEVGDYEGVYEYEVKPNMENIFLQGFRQICTNYLESLNQQKLLPFKCLSFGKWWRKEIDIDILGYGPKDELLIGHCFWKINEKLIDEELDYLIRVSEKYFKQSKISYYVFINGKISDKLIGHYKLKNNINFIEGKYLFI